MRMKSAAAAIVVFIVAHGVAFAENSNAPLQGATSMTAASPDMVKELTPTGTLRVAINLGNIVLAQTDDATGRPKGVTVDLARELARRLGVPVEFATFDAAGKAFEVLK